MNAELQDKVDETMDLNIETDTTSEQTSTKQTEDKLVQLPMGRIRSIMKTDPDIPLLSQESVFAITKATEMFIQELAKEAYNYTIKSKKKTLQKKDVDNAIDNVDSLAFLEEMSSL